VTGGYPIFRALAQYPVDFFLFLGDTIYADHVCSGPEFVPGSGFVARTLPQFHAKHRYNRADSGVQDYFRRTPVYVIWDDHEVRDDFAGTIDPLMSVGLRAFIDYFPIEPPAADPDRLYRSFRWGDLVEVFILDTRQYRSANTQLDGPGKTMLGAAQKRWLLDGVGSSTATWKFVISSVSLSVPKGGAARDSWSNANGKGVPQEGGTGFTVERDQILRQLRDRKVTNLVFLAADVHHAELIRHHPAPEWSFHEFMAGPLSASPGRRSRRAGRLLGLPQLRLPLEGAQRIPERPGHQGQGERDAGQDADHHEEDDGAPGEDGKAHGGAQHHVAADQPGKQHRFRREESEHSESDNVRTSRIGFVNGGSWSLHG
jgi:alkaline phosphatase D